VLQLPTIENLDPTAPGPDRAGLVGFPQHTDGDVTRGRAPAAPRPDQPGTSV